MFFFDTQSTHMNSSLFKVDIFRLNNSDDKQAFETLRKEQPALRYTDNLQSQLEELVKCLYPHKKLKGEALAEAAQAHLGTTPSDEYGCWVYYPWRNEVIHLLDEKEFTYTRTSRNKYKITPDEQDILREKTIAVAGLSVGRSIAVTMAMEGIFREIRLADFDIIELSNLNRICTGVFDFGVDKTLSAARQILEIDPFVRVRLFSNGLNADNMEDFFMEGGKADIFIEECDSLDVKIRSREMAKSLKIPVVMDTNDRGMIDIERFDLYPERPIFHGKIEGLDTSNLADLTTEEKLPFVMQIVGMETISTRLKASMMEVGESTTSWAQLASAVALGGGIVTEVARRILLGEKVKSGRFYVDTNELIPAEQDETVQEVAKGEKPALLSQEFLKIHAERFLREQGSTLKPLPLKDEQLKSFVKAACEAPSGGNVQPWSWLYHNNLLFLFHEKHRSISLLDTNHTGSFLSFGAAIENLKIKCAAEGMGMDYALQPLAECPELVSVISFNDQVEDAHLGKLEPTIYTRETNRHNAKRVELPSEVYEELGATVEEYKDIKIRWSNDAKTLKKLGTLIGRAERIRTLNKRSHAEMMSEVRWSSEEAETTKDGIDMATTDITEAELMAMKVSNDWSALELLSKWGLGAGLEKMMKKNISSASGIGMVSIPKFSLEGYFESGRAIQRIWLEANHQNIDFQPITPATFMFSRIKNENGEGLSESEKSKLLSVQQEINNIFGVSSEEESVFLFRICKSSKPRVKSYRYDTEKVLYTNI